MADTETTEGLDSVGERGWQTVPSRRRTKKPRQVEAQTSKHNIPDSSPASLDAHQTPDPDDVISFAVPHPRDRIFSKARKIVIAHNRKSFAHYTDPLRLHAFDRHQTTYNGDESDAVDLALTYRQTGIRIAFRLLRGTFAKGRYDNLECNVTGGWQEFAKWLDGLKPPPGREVFGARAMQLQQQWWAKNSQQFKLMELPTELRILVLEHAVGPVLYLNKDLGSYSTSSDSPTYACSGARSIRVDPTKEIVSKPNLDFIFHNRQLYEEVKPYLFYRTAKVFTTPTCLRKCVFDFLPRSLGGLQRLCHLDLDFALNSYILFFNVQVAPVRAFDDHNRLQVRGNAAMLLQLPFLKSLRLHFRSPIGMADDSPWQHMGPYNGYERFCDYAGYRDRTGFKTPCQKFIVDWVLTYAKSYIQHIPKVLLTGYIKNSTKAKWDGILAQERAGTPYDERADKQVISTWPDTDMPPTCHCTTPCRFSDCYSIVSHRECRMSWPQCNCRPLPEKFADKLISRYVFDYED